MRITLESLYEDNTKIIIEQNAESIHDTIDLIESALLAYGFHPDTVKDGFLAKAEDYDVEDLNEDKT